MGRTLTYLVFITIGSLVVAGWHYYLWARLVRDPGWSPAVTRVLTVVVVLLAVSLPGAMMLSRLLPSSASSVVAWGAFIWMGTGFVLLVLVAGADLLWAAIDGASRLWTLGAGGGSEAAPPDPERRQLIARSVAGVVGATGAVAAVHGIRGALGEVVIEDIEVPLARLPRELDGLSIVQLTDIHVGPTIGRRFVEGLVEKTNALRPDVVVITGDLVDGPVPMLMDGVDPLGDLAARYGVYFVTGNHEYYSGVGPWTEALEKIGIRVLNNERVVIGDDGASLDLAGIPDPTAARMGPQPPSVAVATAGRDPERELVLLAHQPRVIDEAAAGGVGLQLSGHTHGGQIFPFGALVGLVQPYVSGLHLHGETRIYVSRGTGYWGPPMRIGVPAEISRLHLTAG